MMRDFHARVAKQIMMVLQPAQPLVGAGDDVEGLDHFGLKFCLDCGDREPILHIVIVEVTLAERPAGCLAEQLLVATRSSFSKKAPFKMTFAGSNPACAASRAVSPMRFPGATFKKSK
jgi:hypothetical protein